jgi:hypothetical protein
MRNRTAQYLQRIASAWFPEWTDFQPGLAAIGDHLGFAAGFDLPEEFQRPGLNWDFDTWFSMQCSGSRNHGHILAPE